MPIRPAAFRSHRTLHGALLTSVSALTLFAYAMPAHARMVGSGGAVTAAPQVASDAAIAAQQAAMAAAKRSQSSLSRATQAVQAMQAAQAKANALARSAPSSSFNGMSPGGLVPVANPVPAAQDTTGLRTWEGASLPTQTTDANGQVDVTVRQTQTNAILSWQSFNVGSRTTLTFDQQGNASWVALNRVVGSTAPSQILGNIRADGTVLVINQNGIIFGGGSQINVGSLIASTLDVGQAVVSGAGNNPVLNPTAQRNQTFLASGLLSSGFSPAEDQVTSINGFIVTYGSPGSILVQNGAQITSADNGYVLMAAPAIENAGHLSATDGQVILAAGDALNIQAATGAADSLVPGIRGLLVVPLNLVTTTQKSVVNDESGLIESARGSIFLGSANAATTEFAGVTHNGIAGVTVNKGGLFASTSVSRNGAIEVSGPNIELSPGSIIAITPDDSGETIPQDPSSVADFKPSQITIGNLNGRFGSGQVADSAALIDIATNTLTFAPSGNITIGAQPGATAFTGQASTSRIFVDDGAVIDAAGLKDVEIPASRNELKISPLTTNDLADDQSNLGVLKDATVYVDPRLSGVRSDGVAWIGSPLIDAASYYQQVGVSASELMTKGGNVSLGVDSFAGGTATMAPNIVVKAGATIDISGGWVTYQAGQVHTTQLIDASGHIVDIGHADPNDTFIGIYKGFTVNHPHWGISETYVNLLHSGSYYEPEYTEGRDAGSLTVKASASAIDGAVFAQAFPGERQISDAEVGTGTSSVYGDERSIQAAPSQLPAGGFLLVQAQASAANGSSGSPGGANIVVESAADYQALPGTLGYGQSIQVASDGTVTVPTRDPNSLLTPSQLGTINLSDAFLSDSGFGQVTLTTTGTVTVASDADVTLNPGGIFNVLAGHKITINGTVSAAGGQISLATSDLLGAQGSVFTTNPQQVGNYDVVINGTLSTRGRWVNDFGVTPDSMAGSAWLNGGSITLYAAPRVSTSVSVPSGATPATATDLSGSIYINTGSVVDVSGGGRVDQTGKLNLTAHGGNLSLYDETSYYQISASNFTGGTAGALDGFRVTGLASNNPSAGTQPYVPVNPDQINARVLIDPNAIRAQGFGGGGTFTLATPEFAFSDDTSSDASANATRLPLSFFSTAGFASYNITSYKTALFANPFNNGLGGTDAVLATQTLTIGAGQTLDLTQAMLPSILGIDQTAALRSLATGGDVFSVLSAGVPTNAWDRKAVSLTLGGLLELHVAQGGSITGDAGAALTVSKLLNEGTIRLPGGSITQQEILPKLYTAAGVQGIRSLSDIFTVDPDGTITEGTASRIAGLTNGQLAGSGQVGGPTDPIYFVGLLDANQGIVLAPGSVTDLSGASIRNPYATTPGGGSSIATGRMVDGGSITTLPTAAGPQLYSSQYSNAYSGLAASSGSTQGINQTRLDTVQIANGFVLDPGSTLNLSGASDTYDQPVLTQNGLRIGATYVPTPVWSNGGTLAAGGNLIAAGATILAQGGAPQALGGTLAALDPVLTQHDPATPTANVISADMITNAGFDTLVAYGSVSNSGDVTVNLGRGFFLETRPLVNNGQLASSSTGAGDNFVPTVRSGGGTLEIDTPYVQFDSNFDTISTSALGTAGNGTVIFNANNIDFIGAMVIDQSVGNATLTASGDIRLTGVVPWQQVYYPGTNTTATLNGQIAANGNLNLIAGQLYPTTGSTFTISSSAASGTITFGRSGAAPAAPYSAGGNLTVLAASIVQGGVIRVPLGTLQLGGAALTDFAPATESVTLADGSLTSVSANGLVIPYGTTTDQTEWFFAPTNTDALTAPPQKLLGLNGTNVAISSGATIDLTGSGDVYAYEFVPGTGGSRDVLSRQNPDPYTSNNGLQYPDGRQVYAIVPGVSSNAVAAYDPIYSANYANLGSVGGVGTRVWLNAAPGLAAGWYTLLPAQYAMLPGGMRVVEQTGASNLVANVNGRLLDGTVITTGRYGDALSGGSQSQLRLFDIQSQAVINRESNIVLTTGNSYFAALAAHNVTATPRLPVDAGRLVLDASADLVLDDNAVFKTGTPAGGLGAQVDIGGANIDILASLAGAPADGAIHLTASSLTNLHADSLLIGGTRTDRDDGTTTLNITAQDVLVQNDAATPLSAGEIVLTATSDLTVADGSVISATGTLSDTRSGAYQIGSADVTGSGTGALVRVANGPQRLVARTNSTTTATLNAGAATFSGNAVMFDSSGANTLSAGVVIQNAKFVALGAPRIGIGVDPATYNGLALTDALQSVLGQNGALVTLRSQSSIDFADGTYDFGSIGFDAVALTGLGGGAVTVNADTISLGNSSAPGTVCATCNTNNGSLAINANRILFTGGTINTQAVTATSSTSIALANNMTFMLPVGTVIAGVASTTPLPVTVPAGTVLTAIPAGTALVLPSSADGTVAEGTTVTLPTVSVTLPPGTYTFPSGIPGNQFQTGLSELNNAATVTVPAGTQGSLGADTQVATTPFFGGVTLSAQNGIYAEGAGGGLIAGPAALALHTPYIGDRTTPLAPGVNAVIPALTLSSSNTVTIDNIGVGTADTIDGIPGASVVIGGQQVSVSGTTIHATAGSITITSATGVTLGNGAVIEAPGYTKMFGDAADPTPQNAPGGQVSLVAQNGDIALGNATLSVGGGTGDAGTLSLSAPNGAVTGLATATLNGTPGAGGAGGTFSLDANGAVDLAALNAQVGADGFTGAFKIHTSTGDLTLAAGQSLRSGAVSLTADGGLLTIAGTIDVSGVNGGNVDLYGIHGVTLTGTAHINATASGYAAADPTDTRQATGGNVTIGTDFISATTSTADGSVTGSSGRIQIDAGAVIDVSALHPGDRLVPTLTQAGKVYNYVRGDVGGTVTLRAPVQYVADKDSSGNPLSNPDGTPKLLETVNVHVANASSVVGASSVVIEAFQRWDLGAVAQSGTYTGVTLGGGTVTLDVTAGLDTPNADGTTTTVAGLNFLGDRSKDASGNPVTDVGAAGATLVDYVQNFDLSAASGNLGGLAAQANFHARPGIDLINNGDITLASNWNLGAGTVNVTGATLAGLMTTSPANGEPAIVVGDEAQILAKYTTMTYRVGGTAFGEPGVLSLRASGNLNIGQAGKTGSITDGFFTFGDQTDIAYLNPAAGGNIFNPVANPSCSPSCDVIGDFTGAVPTNKLIISFASGGANVTTVAAVNLIPYDAAANTPAAQGTGEGDPISSAVIFPLIQRTPNDPLQPVQSWSYQLTGGAKLGSVNPLQVKAGANGAVTVQGTNTYTYGGVTGGLSSTWLVNVDNNNVDLSDWANAEHQLFGNLDQDSAVQLTLSALPIVGRTNFEKVAGRFFASTGPDHLVSGTDYAISGSATQPTTVYTTLKEAVAFLQYIGTQPEWSSLTSGNIKSSYPATGGTVQLTTISTQTLIRTGTGSIALAAAGDINLTNGSPAARPYYGATGALQGTAIPGGTAIYTAGHPADTTPVTLIAPDTGLPVTVTFPGAPASNLSNTQNYLYGATGNGVTGVLIADPIYAEGGGDIAVDAGRDVLSRRDNYWAAALAFAISTPSWIGGADEPWRSGGTVQATTGDNRNLTTSAAIDPQLFAEGLGALGGGNITVKAGRNVSDLSVIATDSLMTASAGGTKTLATFGRGNVNIAAGNDILGGRVDVASGAATITAARDILAAGTVSVTSLMGGSSGTIDNLLVLRLTDARVDVQAGSNLDLQGVAGLGVIKTTDGDDDIIAGDLASLGLYSAHAGLDLTANGTVAIANEQDNLLTGISSHSNNVQNAIYPGTFVATALTGDLSIGSLVNLSSNFVPLTSSPRPSAVLMVPSPVGQLQLFAGGSIAPVSLAMLDADPATLPNWFGIVGPDGNSLPASWVFPTVLPGTSELMREQLHNRNAIHAGDSTPVRIAAGTDIGTAGNGLILSVPKQARIYAGRDIINMMFFGQNLDDTDITRIVAGRDITATTVITTPTINTAFASGTPEPAVQGNTFVIGGPGSFMLEAGRDLGPFLNSATVNEVSNVGGTHLQTETYGGGILAVGNDWNPWLPAKSASISVMFGVANGINYDGLREAYLDPANLGSMPDYLFAQAATTKPGVSGTVDVADRSKPIYGAMLLAWMQANRPADLIAAFGTTDVTYPQAYQVFAALPQLAQRVFLNQIYFNELKQTAVKDGPSYQEYARGYTAVNTLFPASYGYTANDLSGGSNGANAPVVTGNLDLRLATIQTGYGGDIDIMGPGGRVIAGSTVRTDAQAARRTYDGGRLFGGRDSITTLSSDFFPLASAISTIPSGYEGVLTLRGGAINTFTDGDFLLNQSRLFTEQGGEITMWSSNADLNAGQGPKTSANFPPVLVKVDPNLFVQTDQAGATSGAGIAALQATPDSPPSNVYLIAPRGTVDAGAAGLRVSGNLSIAALQVLNTANIQVQGTTVGIPTVQGPPVGALTAASNTTAATQQVTQPTQANNDQPSVIFVEVVGYGGGGRDETPVQDQKEDDRHRKTSQQQGYDPNSAFHVIGNGQLTDEQMKSLTDREKTKLEAVAD